MLHWAKTNKPPATAIIDCMETGDRAWHLSMLHILGVDVFMSIPKCAVISFFDWMRGNLSCPTSSNCKTQLREMCWRWQKKFGRWIVLSTSNFNIISPQGKGDIGNDMKPDRLWKTNMKYENPMKNKIDGGACSLLRGCVSCVRLPSNSSPRSECIRPFILGQNLQIKIWVMKTKKLKQVNLNYRIGTL